MFQDSNLLYNVKFRRKHMKFGIVLALVRFGKCIPGASENNINNLLQEGNKYATKITELWASSNLVAPNKMNKPHNEN